MRRALAAALVLPWALAASGPATSAEPAQVLFRASASATAVHGFYDHEGLFPVPILNVSVPYTRSSLEPGPSSQALGSFLWDPEVAELGTIFCVLSEGRFCEFPEYPFQANASYPSAGPEPSPPTLSVDDPGAPVQVRAAHEEAQATEEGAHADASAATLRAIPMSPRQAAAARGLAALLGPLAGPAKVTPWLVEVRVAASGSSVRAGDGGAVAAAESEVQGLRLLGGLITAEVIRGESRSAIGDRRTGSARARVARLRVGELRAEIGPKGLRIADEELGGEQLATITDALGGALSQAGMEVGPGLERVRRRPASVESVAYAFSVDFRRRNLPEELPEGTQGADVLRVPVGLATSRVAVAQILDPPGEVAPPPVDTAGPAPGTVAGAGDARSVPALPATGVAPVGSGPEAVAAAPVVGITDLGVPLGAVIVVGLAGLGAVLLLSCLKVNEVLSE
ncbi:MAG: choice-of-anchor P family protein [Actinomycetota bacterium]